MRERPDGCWPGRAGDPTWSSARPRYAPARPGGTPWTRGADAGEVRFVDAIYEASAVRLLGLVQATEETVGSLMLIGHGPGLPGLAEGLGARPEPRAAWARMDTKYPTAGLTVLRLSGPWAAATPGEAELVAFEVPRG